MKATYNAQTPQGKKDYRAKQDMNAMIATAVDAAIKKDKRATREATRAAVRSAALNMSQMDLNGDGEITDGNATWSEDSA